MSEFLSYLDSHIGVLRAMLITPIALYCAYCVFVAAKTESPAPGRSWLRELGVAFLFFLVLASGRWPHFCENIYLSPDESQQLAAALTLLHHPVIWRDLDGHTAGPLNFYILSAIGLLHIPINYFIGRLFTAILQTITAWCVYKIIRVFLSPGKALLAACPLLCFYCCMDVTDTLMYSTEQVSACLLIVAFYLIVQSVERPTSARLFWGGLLAGATPWAKLQSAPISLTLLGLGLIGLVSYIKQLDQPKKYFLTFLAGYAAPTLFFGSLILITQQASAFFHSYITSNFSYTASGRSRLQVAVELWHVDSLLRVLILAAVGWTVVAYIIAAVRKTGIPFAHSGTILLLFASTIACLAPGRAFPHYTLFLIGPLGLLCGLSFALVLPVFESKRIASAFPAILLAASTLVPILAFRMEWYGIPEGLMQLYWGAGESDLSMALRPHLRRGDDIVVWGWYPHLYVQLQVSQGVRDGQTERVVRDSPFRQYYHQRFLDDLNTRTPVAIIDAVGPQSILYTNRAKDGIPAYPDIMAYVRAHYRQIFDGGNGVVYLRNDRP